MAKETIPADLLKRVQRPVTDKKGQVVTEKKGNNDVPKLRAIKADEVLSWRESDGEVAVVTTDGQKFRSTQGA